LRQLVVATSHGVPVRLADVAAIESGFAPPTCLLLLDDAEVAGGRVRLRDREAASAAQVATALRQLEPALPPGVTLIAEEPGAIVRTMDVRLPAAASLEERVRLARALGTRLRAHPAVARVRIDLHAGDGTEADALVVRAALRPDPA